MPIPGDEALVPTEPISPLFDVEDVWEVEETSLLSSESIKPLKLERSRDSAADSGRTARIRATGR